MGGCKGTGPGLFFRGCRAGLVIGSERSGSSTSGVCTGLGYPRPPVGGS